MTRCSPWSRGRSPDSWWPSPPSSSSRSCPTIRPGRPRPPPRASRDPSRRSAQLQAMLSTLKDAETGQRGYLLTGRESYLEPFETATQALAPEMRGRQVPGGRRAGPAPSPRKSDRAREREDAGAHSERSICATPDKPMPRWRLVLSDRGKNTMDRIRALSEEMQSEERQLVAEKALAWRKAATFSFAVTSGGSLALLFLIGLAATMASRDFRARQRESWLRAGQLGLSDVMQGDLPLERLGDNVVRYLAQYLDAQAGAVFIAEGSAYRRVGGYALPPGDAGARAPRRRARGTGGEERRAAPCAQRAGRLSARGVGNGRGAVGATVDRARVRRRPSLRRGGVRVLRQSRCGEAAAPRADRGAAGRRHPRIQGSNAARGAVAGDPDAGGGAANPRRGAARQQRGAGGAVAARCASRERSSSRSRRSSSRSTPSSRSRPRRSSIRRTRCSSRTPY